MLRKNYNTNGRFIFGHKFMTFLKVCLKGNYGMVEVVAAEYVRKCRLIIKDLHF